MALATGTNASTNKTKQIFLLAVALATFSGTQVACKKQPSSAECNELEYDLSVAAQAFPQTCTADADCIVEHPNVSRNGDVCLPFYCGFVVAQATFENFKHFLATDPNVTAKCNTVLDSGCPVSVSTLPHCPAAKPGCDGGRCGVGF